MCTGCRRLKSKKYLPPVMVIREGRAQLLADWHTPYGTIPDGFSSNGVSSPKWLQWLVKPFGQLLEAAIFHDYYYENAIKTKDYADKAFRMIAIDFGVHSVYAHIAYLAVKLFGKGKYQ